MTKEKKDNVVMIPIDSIRPYSKNAKTHSKKQIKQVADSIKSFGFNQAIVSDENGVIIVGHGRYEAAKLLGMKEVPVLTVKLDEEQAKAYRLSDNKLNESPWEMELVIQELKTLSLPMLVLTGFDADLIVEPDAKDDIIPENVPARSKLDDLYELGQHRLLCGDSTQPEAVLRLMDGKKADMVFTDPPYGMNLDTDYSSMSKDSKKYDKIIGDDKPYDPAIIFDLFGYCKEILLFGADYYVDRLPNFGRDGSWIVWDKRVEEKYDKVIGSSYEMLWMKQKHRREILRYNYVSWQARMADGKKTHPTMKPVGLLSQVIVKTIGESKLTVDLFLGSGSTLIACEKTGRICYGMELDPRYTDVIVQRYVDYVPDAVVKCNGKVIEWKKS